MLRFLILSMYFAFSYTMYATVRELKMMSDLDGLSGVFVIAMGGLCIISFIILRPNEICPSHNHKQTQKTKKGEKEE